MTLQLKRWNREAYSKLAECGAISVGERVELIEGDIVAMSPQSPGHSRPIALLTTLLTRSFADTHIIRVQLPLDLGEWSQPEPDFSLVSFSDFPQDQHPERADLIVEVALSSLAYDLRAKASVYAKAGLSELWVIDVARRQLIVLRQPQPDMAGAYGHDYATRQTLQVGEFVSPLFCPTRSLAVDQLVDPQLPTARTGT